MGCLGEFITSPLVPTALFATRFAVVAVRSREVRATKIELAFIDRSSGVRE